LNEDFKNAEGYLDPTPYEAIRNIEGRTRPPFMPLVYICSPYSSAPKANIKHAREFCRFTLNHGRIPLAPHLMFPQFMSDTDPTERDLALFMNIVLMGKCQELWVLGDEISAGMKIEIEKAKKRRQRVRYFNSRFEEVDSLA